MERKEQVLNESEGGVQSQQDWWMDWDQDWVVERD